MTNREDEMYKLRHIDAYEELKYPDGWLKCKVCGVLPRSWCFNNGRFATCLCFQKYDEHPARAESVMSVHKRTGGSTREYDADALRVAWNTFVTTGKLQNELGEGKW